ncbi:hypothetical protein AB0H83_41780 [Dactylosporangium sp. NPDC050688]|uniref:hypothetical protein n=1 Tax=Dactylosporangium sp. NPDC050688 TaxID=3157217 RepID=UPI0033DA71AC
MAVGRDPLPWSWRRASLTVALHAALTAWVCTPVIWLLLLVEFALGHDTAAAIAVDLSALVFAVVVPFVVLRVARRTEREIRWEITWVVPALIGLVVLGVFDACDMLRGP